jgi:hypothetical protein
MRKPRKCCTAGILFRKIRKREFLVRYKHETFNVWTDPRFTDEKSEDLRSRYPTADYQWYLL